VFEKPHWRTVLTTKDMAKALALAKEIGCRTDHVEAEETLDSCSLFAA
jgi:hypothetical protein